MISVAYPVTSVARKLLQSIDLTLGVMFLLM